MTASAEAQLEIVVEGRHPLTIAQATVDTVMAEPHIGDNEALARGLQSTNCVNPEVNRFWVFVLLALSMILGLVTLALVISNGGDISMSLGRFGRRAATLKRLRAQLGVLTLGLDDARINAVAMLGRGKDAAPAESDQRIYESALAVAWRMVDGLAARPRTQRLAAEYVARWRSSSG